MPRGRPAGSGARARWRRRALTGSEARSSEPDPVGAEVAGLAAARQLDGSCGAGEGAGEADGAGWVCGTGAHTCPSGWDAGAAAD